MSETFVAPTITGVSIIVVALITLITNFRLSHKVKALKEDSAATRAQVENDHPTNLREESDARHGEVMHGIHRLDKQLEGVNSDIRGLRKDIGRNDTRIHDLESTKKEL